MVAPAVAGADVVNDLLKQLGLGGLAAQQAPAPAPSQGSAGSDGSGSAGTSDRAGVPPTYVPPLHGTNPHAQGDVATISLLPTGPNPVTGEPGQPETIIVGSARGEQNGDAYHGHITIASLLGTELLSVDTDEGESAHGPLDALQTTLLNGICDATTASLTPICLGLLTADSETTATGSTNSFSVATIDIGPATSPIQAGVATSTATISDDGTCQTATSTSNVADANVLGAIQADSLDGGTQTSIACNNGTAPTTTNTGGKVVNLMNAGVPIPVPGCADGTPNSNFDVLVPLLSAVCNASDQGTTGQAEAPYGVQEALSVFVLAALGSDPLVKAVTAGPETRAAAPAVTTPPVTPPVTPPGTPPGDNGGGNPGGGNNNNNDGGDGGPDGGSGDETASGGEAGSGDGNLAFTGANLVWLAMLGLGLVGAGLAMYAALPGSRRPRLNA